MFKSKTVTPISGGNMLLEDESIILPYDINESEDGLILFGTNSFGSSEPNLLISFMQWGAANQSRAG